MPVRATIAALFLLVLAAACGGGDGGGGDRLTREEYAAQANEICKDFDEKIKDVEAPSSPGEVDEYADEAIPIFEDSLQRLKDLEPPEALERKVDEWLGLGDEILDALKDLRDAAKDDDQTKVQQIFRETQEKDKRSDELAQQIGATECASA
jgi:hypothetical protein